VGFEFQNLENLLTRLVGSISGVFRDSEIKEIQEFIDVGEYGVALETFASIVEEEDKLITDEVLGLAKEAAVLMNMNEAMFELKLAKHVIDRQKGSNSVLE